MSQYYVSKVASNFTSVLRHGCSPVNLLHIFRTLFPKNTSGGLLLVIAACILLHEICLILIVPINADLSTYTNTVSKVPIKN